MITADPTKLDLGEIPTADSGTGTVRLTNTGEEPRTLVDCKKTCGCTTINCPKHKVLQPGEHIDIEVRMNGGTRATKLNKNVTFIFSDGHPPVRVGVAAQAVSYVSIEPELLDKTRNPDGMVVLTAIDDQPFTVKSMYPPVIEQFSTEASARHELVFDWARWEELGAQRKLMFSLDHPKCAKLYGTIDAASVPPRQPRKPGDPPTTTPTPRAPDLGRMIKSDQIEQAIQMIDDGKIDVEGVDRAGKSPLLVASELGAVEVMQALLDASADIGAVDRVGRTALMWAAQSKNVEAVNLLLDADADFTAKDNIGNTAVSWACGFGDAASVKALLDAGASIEVTGAVGGFTPIIWAAGFGEAATLELLIDAGADINTGDILQGATPLMHAVRTNRPDNVRLLLEAGADLEARDHKGQTPFLVAAANSGADTSMLQLLLDAGAKLDDVDGNNQNALDLARRRTDLRAAAVVAMLQELMGIEPEPATPPATPAGGDTPPQGGDAGGGNTESDGG
jgi:ankyrin repeat protein